MQQKVKVCKNLCKLVIANVLVLCINYKHCFWSTINVNFKKRNSPSVDMCFAVSQLSTARTSVFFVQCQKHGRAKLPSVLKIDVASSNKFDARPFAYDPYYDTHSGWLETRRAQAHFSATFISMFDLSLSN